MERQEAVFVNSVWKERFPDSNGLSAVPIKSRAVSEISFKAPSSGKDVPFIEEETGGSRTSVKFLFPLKLFTCWCSRQPLLGTGTQNESLTFFLGKIMDPCLTLRNHLLISQLERKFLMSSVHHSKSFRKKLQLLTCQPLVRYSDVLWFTLVGQKIMR